MLAFDEAPIDWLILLVIMTALFFFIYKVFIFIYFIFVCVGSSLWCVGFSCCGALALGTQASVVVAHRL